MSLDAQIFRVHCFDDIFSRIGRMVERRDSLEPSWNELFNEFPLVGGEFVCRFIRDLECVGCIDLILVLVLDVVVLLVTTNSLLLGRLFVGGQWDVSLAWHDE